MSKQGDQLGATVTSGADLDSLDLFTPTTEATPGAAPRKCRRHEWRELPPRVDTAGQWRTEVVCNRCGVIRDETKAKRGRNNRARGNREELTVARVIGGRKVGPLGHPWDVEIEGYARLQVKKLARWPSLTAVIAWMDAIPPSREMRGVVLVQPGRRPRRLIVLDLDEFAEHHGDPTEGGAA